MMKETYADRVTGGCIFEHITSFFEVAIKAPNFEFAQYVPDEAIRTSHDYYCWARCFDMS